MRAAALLACVLPLLCAASPAFLLGVNIDPANPAGYPVPSNLTDLGSAAVRIEYKDTAGGTPMPDPKQVAFYANVLQKYSEAQSVLMILDYSMLPGFPSPNDGDSVWQAYINNFAARAGVLAGKFGSMVDAYEIWNEEDLAPQPGYNVYVPPERYACILSAAYKAIKAQAPGATVVMGGLASGDPTYVTNVVNAPCSGGKVPADAVGVHPYGRRPTSDWPSSTWGFGVITDFMASYYSVSNVPLWITEVGTNDMTVQADFPQRTFEALAAAEASIHTTAVFWFCWSDGMVNPFGLVDASGAPKPSYSSFQAYAKQ